MAQFKAIKEFLQPSSLELWEGVLEEGQWCSDKSFFSWLLDIVSTQLQQTAKCKLQSQVSDQLKLNLNAPTNRAADKK